MIRRVFIAAVVFGSVISISSHSILATELPQAKLLYKVDTTDKVVFFTADDGADKPADAAAELARLQWPITSFILPTKVGTFASWFSDLGSRNDIATHSARHIALKGLSFEKQKKEICEGERRIKEKFGSTTGYFRPPYGSWDKRTLQAAAACGISHVVLWTVSLNGRTITTWDGKIHPGNIVLVHYVRSMAQSIRQLEKRLKRQGLSVARLSDYLK
jgi:peptidoglycan/xylan/chitin deacetylase (PgdA/CDA1 family)